MLTPNDLRLLPSAGSFRLWQIARKQTHITVECPACDKVDLLQVDKLLSRHEPNTPMPDVLAALQARCTVKPYDPNNLYNDRCPIRFR